MRIAFDCSSFMWTGLFAGKDGENGYEAADPVNPDKKVWINSAKHGYENVMNMMVGALDQFGLAPIDAILVFEGMHSKQKRRAFDPIYKAGEDKAPENYAEFEKLREIMRNLWRGLGSTLMSQDFVEGDDVLAYLAREAEQDLVIATGDGDLTILHGTNAHGSKVIVRRNHDPLGQHPYGPWDRQLITLWKALVGDRSDKIRGVEGFGEKSFNEMMLAYGEDGMHELLGLLAKSDLGPLYPQVGEDKLIKKIVDQEKNAVRSYRVARLYPEWVNTAQVPLVIEAGMVTPKPAQVDERVAQYYGQTFLVTADSLQGFIEWMPRIIEESPFATFDIETSTPGESDEWIAAQTDGDRLDQLGSELTGFSLTLGRNTQYTMYFSVDHANTNNITLEQARKVIEMIPKTMHLVIQNTAFELCVCYQAFAEHWQDNGYRGFLPNILDTMFENSYVDENSKLGLKDRSKRVLGYEQQTFDQVTKLAGPMGTLQPGGRQIRVFEQADTVGDIVDGEIQYGMVEWEERRYKMNELTAKQVVGYGCDDTICTAALHVYNRLVMEIEHTWKVYLEVEIDAAYQHAVNFLTGMAVSVEKINELSAADDIVYENAWKVASAYLIEKKYEGTQPPVYGELTAADVKEAFTICTGRKMDTAMRTLSKLVIHCREVENEPSFALALNTAITGGPKGLELFNRYVTEHFKGEPENPLGSPTKMAKLMYEMMGLPIRVRNKATDAMRQAGIYEGNPKTDQLSIEYALQMDATPDQKEVLEAFKLMQMVRTRRSLYYTKYPYFVHWKDGMVHPSHNQCSTNTRRASESGPNKQQLAKHQKIEGQAAKIRECVVPHKRNAVVVSMDFESQELKIIADYSDDPNLVACYVGDNKKDVHALTGVGVYKYKQAERRAKGHDVPDLNYDQFEAIRHGEKSHPLFQFVKDDRNLGKKVNFTTEFGAMAPKVAQTLLVSEEAAQAFIDAREAAFAEVARWKERVIAQAREDGGVRTMKGAVRHLAEAFKGDRWVSSKAERQAVNTKVQGSAGEMTKMAEGRMWEDGLFFDFDAICYGPIHDEVVASVLIEDLPAFIPRMHACMVAQFADMRIPITSSISFGPDFYNQTEIGAEPTAAAIAEGLVKMYKAMADRQLEKEAA